MKNIAIILLAIITGAFIIASCNKETISSPKDKILIQKTTTGTVISNCDKFAYSDTIFFLKPQTGDYIVKPLIPLPGSYGAFPTGLQIDTANGNINITRSETGLKYIVWFVASGKGDTCKRFVTVSGVNYNDSIYIMSKNSASASPIYNANTLIPVNCNGCEFDDGPDDDNRNGIADEPPAKQELVPQGFVINKSTGVINFKKSIQNGVLGKSPISGASKEFVLNYRLGDKSGKALNHIGFKLFYYKSQSEIPVKLKQELSAKQDQVLLENENEDEDDDHGGGHGGGGHGGGHSGSGSITANRTATANAAAKNGKAETKCRPPYIIVTER